MKLKGDAYVKVQIRPEAVKGLENCSQKEFSSNYLVGQVSGALLTALSEWVEIDDLEAMLQDEDAVYPVSDGIVYNLTVRQGCETYSDPSVGIQCATNDSIEIPEKWLTEEIKQGVDNINAGVILSATVEIRNEELV